MSDAIEGRPPRSGQDEDYYAGYAYMELPEPTPEFPEPQDGPIPCPDGCLEVWAHVEVTEEDVWTKQSMMRCG
jgi:hypothetical protein